MEKCFLDYSVYGYNRGTNFGGLPAPAYIPGPPTAPEGSAEDGTFEYLSPVPNSDPPMFVYTTGLITTAVFNDAPGDIGGNIGGFVQASDDTRAVIRFMHENQVPVDVETEVPCAPSGDIAYDVLISDVSGLQVPTQMVDGSEGREFTVTVASASGSVDLASGTVTVTAIPESGGNIEGSPWTFEFSDLDAGAAQSWTTFFTVNLGERTTINWTAIAAAPDDVNLSNNTVTATTSVKVTGGGGGGGKP